MNVSTHKHQSGRKKARTSDTIERLRNAPVEQRGMLRSAAEACDITPTQVWRMARSGAPRPHTSPAKSLLDERVREQRRDFCKSFIDETTMAFHDMYDCIHIDEKWFYLATNSRRCYLASDELPPLRAARSKRFVMKVMFLVVVARPRYDKVRGEWFDGKVGMWSPTQQVPA